MSTPNIKVLKVWIARDMDGSLTLFLAKPFRRAGEWSCAQAYENAIWIERDRFPKVTWENSPKEFVLNDD